MTYQGQAYYDQAYSRDKLANGEDNHYRGDWRKSPMLPVWDRIFDRIPIYDCIKIVDLGSGTGQFWDFLRSRLSGKYLSLEYTGIDFSNEAYQLANQRLKTLGGWQVSTEFICAELHGINYKAYPCDLYIACEVLEHLKDDLGLISKLNSGTDIIITVPNFNTRGHVRHFTSEDYVKGHYSKRINIEKVTFDERQYLIKGSVK